MVEENRSGDAAGSGIGGFAAGVLIGAAIAGVVAILYAPRSGKETRERLKAEFQDTKNTIINFTDDMKKKIESIRETVSQSIKEKQEVCSGDGHK